MTFNYHGGFGIVAVGIRLAVTIYFLVLGTSFVRAFEKFAEKGES